MTTPTQRAVAALLCEVTGEDAEWLAGLGPDTRLDGDLFVDSLELAALAAGLADRYGVDLAGHVAGLDLDALLRFSIADVASLVDGAS